MQASIINANIGPLFSDCQDLLKGLLEINQSKRLTMQDIVSNKWFKTTQKPTIDNELVSQKSANIGIINFMCKNFGWVEKDIVDSVHTKKTNNMSATYYLLLRKLQRGREKVSQEANLKSRQRNMNDKDNTNEAKFENVIQDDELLARENTTLSQTMDAQTNHKPTSHSSRETVDVGYTGTSASRNIDGATCTSSPRKLPNIDESYSQSDFCETAERKESNKTLTETKELVGNYKECLKKLKESTNHPLRSVLKSSSPSGTSNCQYGRELPMDTSHSPSSCSSHDSKGSGKKSVRFQLSRTADKEHYSRYMSSRIMTRSLRNTTGTTTHSRQNSFCQNSVRHTPFSIYHSDYINNRELSVDVVDKMSDEYRKRALHIMKRNNVCSPLSPPAPPNSALPGKRHQPAYFDVAIEEVETHQDSVPRVLIKRSNTVISNIPSNVNSRRRSPVNLRVKPDTAEPNQNSVFESKAKYDQTADDKVYNSLSHVHDNWNIMPADKLKLWNTTLNNTFDSDSRMPTRGPLKYGKTYGWNGDISGDFESKETGELWAGATRYPLKKSGNIDNYRYLILLVNQKKPLHLHSICLVNIFVVFPTKQYTNPTIK